MKLKIYVLLGIIALLSFNCAQAFTSSILPASNIPAKKINPLSLITAREFLTLTPKKFEELSGKKMNVVQRIEFKMLQHKVKKMVKKGEVITMADVAKKMEDDSLMNILGFLLGLILGPVGVIIVLILKESGDMSQTAFRWSLYGLIIFLLWFLLVLIL
jgi:hypothetical protein